MKRPRSWLHTTALSLLFAGCFPPLDKDELDAEDTAVGETLAVDTERDEDASDTVATDTGESDTSADAASDDALDVGADADVEDDADVGECSEAEDCPPAPGPCREPACVAHTCEVVNVDGDCDDGDLCTTNDHCAGGGCVSTPVTCTALDSCHAAGTCDPTTGTCTSPLVEDGTACDDHDACTTTDRCSGGSCEGTGSPNDNVGDWTRAFGGSGADAVRWIERTPGGGVAVCGTFEGPQLSLGPSPTGEDVVVENLEGAQKGAFAARFDMNGRPLAATLLGASTSEIDCEGGLAVDASGSLTVAGSWRGSFESAIATPPDAPTSGFYVMRLGVELTGTWAVWGVPTFGEELGALPITMDANDAGQVVIATTGSSDVNVRGQTTYMTLSLPPEEYATFSAGAAVISPLGEVLQVIGAGTPLGGEESAFAITRVLALDSGGVVLGGGVIGGLEIGPLEVSSGDEDEDFDPVVIFVDDTFTPVEFARLSTGQGEDFVTEINEVSAQVVLAVSSAGTGEVSTNSGVEHLGEWSGPAILGFTPDGLPLWLTGFFSAGYGLLTASLGSPPESPTIFVLVAHVGTAVFGDATPPFVVAPASTSVTTLSVVGLDNTGAVIGARRLTDEVAGLGGLGSTIVDLTADGVPTADGYFVGGRFDGALPSATATDGTDDAFVMRRNSQGGLFCD